MQSSFRPDRESRIRTNGQTGRLNKGHSAPRVPFVPHSTTGLLSGRPSGALFPTPRYDYQLLPGRPSEPLLPDSSLRYRLPATAWPPLRAAPSRLLATLPTTSYCLAAPPSRSFPTPRYRLPATVWPRLRAAPSRLLAADYQLLSGRPSEPLLPDSSLPTTSYCLAAPPSRSFPTPRYRLPATVWPPLRAAPSRLLAADYQLLSGRPSEPLLPDSSLLTTSYCPAAPPSRSFPTPRYRLPATIWPRLRVALPDSSLPTTSYCLAAPPGRSFRLLAADYQLLRTTATRASDSVRAIPFSTSGSRSPKNYRGLR